MLSLPMHAVTPLSVFRRLWRWSSSPGPSHLLFLRSSGHDSRTTLSGANLDSRGLLRLEGEDCAEFLQGLITNDIRHLQPHSSGNRSNLFAFLLNPSGRVIADVLVYQRACDSLLLECDKELLQAVRGHLITHRLRKKVAVEVTDELKVWSIYSQSLIPRLKLKDTTVETVSLPSSGTGTSSSPILVHDSRLPIALYRVICDVNQDWGSLRMAVGDQLLQEDVSISVTSEEDYRNFRYRIGMSEGCDDHPMNSALPLESNGDFLHGISFFKGCYIGQELTARSYHTGVIRKRLMPVLLQADTIPETWTSGLEFRTKEGKKLLGKVRSVSGKQGLALLYVDQIKQLHFSLELGDGSPVKSHVPFWWPAGPEEKNV